ncbi:MAG: aminotransferase class V-fold PLP-dependent enzyme [Candidatus Freyarchaeota archaeon]|nr:aminotransferase class V-fold PLP-dependent enzyme [Candidatus Freyrarchaeum guaymaensis]
MLNVLEDFPIAKHVDYLNTAAIGLAPCCVVERVKEFVESVYGKGTLGLSDVVEERMHEGLRVEGARLLGAHVKDVAVFTSVSEALNMIAWSLGLSSGNVVSVSLEFPSVTYPWLRVARSSNIEVKLVEAEGWHVPADKLLDAIDEETKAICVSHVEYLTGQRINIVSLSKAAHDVGAILVVDGIQAAGYIPINVESLGVDVYVTGSYKWMLGPVSAAVAYISRSLWENSEPAFVGWRSTEEPFNFNPASLSYAPSARKFEYSTTAYIAKMGFAESIKYLRRVGIEKIYSHNMKLSGMLIEELEALRNVKVITPLDEKERGAIVTFKIERDAKYVADRLRHLKKPIEVSVRKGMLRASPHLYNTEQDILYLVENLKKLTQ